jgi:MFS transporter, DHA3 family, macrolide efflux protein
MPDPPGSESAGKKYSRLLRNAAYLRVFTAGLGSIAGQSIASICLVWIVFESTHSAIDVGALGASYVIAAIAFSVFTGAWVDRFDRRRLMILSDFSRAVAMTVVVVVLELRGFNLLTVLVAYAVVGAFYTLFNPAEQALVPALVASSDIANANGLVRSSRSTLQFVGTAIAGVIIVTLGGVAGIAANAATFAVSGALLLGLRVPSAGLGRSHPPRTRTGFFRDVQDGFRWLWRAKGFLQLTISATFFNFCWSLIGTFVVIFATEVLHGSALFYALLLASEVAGGAIGALLVGPTHGERWAGRAWVVPYGAASGAVALALALFPSAPVALAALFGIGVLAGYAGTAWLTAAQLLVPTDMQGRYFGIDNLGSIVILPIAEIGGAFIITAYGIETTYLAVAVVWIVAGLVFLAPRALWNLGYRPREPEAALRSGADGAGSIDSPGGTRVL